MENNYCRICSENWLRSFTLDICVAFASVSTAKTSLRAAAVQDAESLVTAVHPSRHGRL